jgi:hypothetical protein
MYWLDKMDPITRYPSEKTNLSDHERLFRFGKDEVSLASGILLRCARICRAF